MQQCIELTDTNVPKHLISSNCRIFRSDACSPNVKLIFSIIRIVATLQHCWDTILEITLVIIDEGKHTFPSRTRSLSPLSLMVVQPRCCVRVSCCQFYDPCHLKWMARVFFQFLQTSYKHIKWVTLKRNDV